MEGEGKERRVGVGQEKASERGKKGSEENGAGG